MFNSNSSEEEDSDSENSSTNEDEGLELTPECNVDSCKDLLKLKKKFNYFKFIPLNVYQPQLDPLVVNQLNQTMWRSTLLYQQKIN